MGPMRLHLGGAGGEDAVFAELVEAADDELEGDEVEDDGGDAEEALQVDLDAAADEEDSEDDGDGDAEEGSGEAEEFGGVEGDGGEDEDGLDAFAEDKEEEDEEEEADFGDAGAEAVYWATFCSMSPFMERAARCMNQIMLMTKAAAASMTQPSMMSELKGVWARATATAMLATMAEPRAQKTVRLNSGRPILLR